MGVQVKNYRGKSRFRLQNVLTKVPSFYLADPRELTDEQIKEATAYFLSLRLEHEARHVKRSAEVRLSKETVCESTMSKSFNKA